jgi:hypothetical protein
MSVSLPVSDPVSGSLPAATEQAIERVGAGVECFNPVLGFLPAATSQNPENP